MFTIDFNKPWLYKDIIYFNQGNLSTNNTLRCKLVTGGSDDFTGGSIACRFETKESPEINGLGKLIDAKNGIIDIVFPSNALIVGTNRLEVLVNRADGGVAQSPPIMYDIWQGLTTGNGVEAETNYPILIELINSTNEASNKANLALNKVNSMITDVTDAIDNAYRSANEADIATSNANTKIEEVETSKLEMVKKVDNSIANMKVETNTAIDNMVSKTDEKITDVNRALAAGTKDLEVKESRRDMDGVEHATLKVRLESDLKKGKVIEETKEGTYLSFNDTIGGLVSYLEVLGNTVQDASNLANIRSSCIPNGDGTFKMSILSCGENTINLNNKVNAYVHGVTGVITSGADVRGVYFKCKPNTSYVISFDKVPNRTVSHGFNEVPKDGVAPISTLSVTNLGNNSYRVESGNAKYIFFYYLNGTYNTYNIWANEGTVATPYTPYEETRCDIKLPCQLEKWDRLYFDRDENAWCVRKGTVTINPTDDILWIMETGSDSQNSSCVRFRIKNNPYATGRNEEVINTHFKNIPDQSGYNSEGVSTSDYGQYGMMVWINKSKLSEVNSTGFNKWRKENNFIAKFGTYTREKIVLPQSEQMKLNSFANKTHIYTISGEVDATVKATVSKSLASTVQANTNEINILNDKIADIQGLKESQDFAYELPNGQNYLVCKDTQNGVVKDLKVYGKSYYNLGGKVDTTVTEYQALLQRDISLFKPNQVYTFAITNTQNHTVKLYVNEHQFIGGGTYRSIEPKTTLVFECTAKSTLVPNDNVILKSGNPPSTIYKLDVVILEGSIKNPPSYFEGIASVGNVNGIKISSRKEDGNLIDINKIDAVRYTGDVVTSKWYVRDNSICVDNITKDYETSIFYYIKVEQNETYSINVNDLNCGILLYQDIVNGHVSANHITSLTSSAKKFTFLARRDYITVRVSAETYKGNLFAEGIMLNKGNIKPYEPYEGDKKPVLFKDTDGQWKPVTELSEFDILDAGRNELLVKSDKVVINETKDWSVNAENSTTIRFATQINNMEGNRNPLICDRYKLKTNYDLNLDASEGTFTSVAESTLYFDILKSNLSTPDVSGLKTLLKVKNVTVVFRTIDTKVYEVNSLEVESYNNGTMISFGSAVIAPYASWKITSSLPNFVKELSHQIKQLQDQVYKTNVANFTVALNTLDTKLRLDRLEAPQQ